MPLTYTAILRRIEVDVSSIPPPDVDRSALHDSPCSYCRNIFPDFGDPTTESYRCNYEREDLFPSFPSLQHTAAQGCRLCSVLQWAIRTNWAVRPMEEWSVGPIREKDEYWADLLATNWDGRVKIHSVSFRCGSTDVMRGLPRSVGSLSFEFGPLPFAGARDPVKLDSCEHGSIGQVIGFKLYATDDNPMIEGIKYGLRQPTAEALSSSNLHLISTWIESCQNGHTLCRLGEDTPTLPTRVVDVGQADDSTEPSLFVSNGTSGIYVALSHCWGKAQPSMPQLKLTSLNIENMTSIIPIQSMPANFRDAVICTRTLGIRYLWIDSLCILQDSAADWEHESANMDGVYRDAILTIAATSATSSHDGFLHRQISNPAFSVRFPPIGHMPSINLVLSLDDDGSSGYWEQDVNNSQWNARAWTMQLSLDYNTCTERIMSRRVLHFCRTKIYFECLTGTESEENESTRGRKPLHPTTTTLDTNGPPKYGEEIPKLPQRYYNNWNNICKSFAARNITFRKDKLPALSGLAHMMSGNLPDEEYHAGIWTGDLHRSLLWYVNLTKSTESISDFVAPSWSWVSSENPVTWGFDSVQQKTMSASKCEVLEISTTLAGQNHYGQITSGSMTIRGVLGELTWIEECDLDDRWFWGTRGTFPYDCLNEEVKVAEAMLDLDKPEIFHENLYYLEIDSMVRPSGLILEAVGDGTDLRYRRVGVAATWDKKGNLFCPTYLHGKERCTVRVI